MKSVYPNTCVNAVRVSMRDPKFSKRGSDIGIFGSVVKYPTESPCSSFTQNKSQTQRCGRYKRYQMLLRIIDSIQKEKKESMEFCLHSPMWYLIKYSGNSHCSFCISYIELYFISRIRKQIHCFYV